MNAAEAHAVMRDESEHIQLQLMDAFSRISNSHGFSAMHIEVKSNPNSTSRDDYVLRYTATKDGRLHNFYREFSLGKRSGR